MKYFTLKYIKISWKLIMKYFKTTFFEIFREIFNFRYKVT